MKIKKTNQQKGFTLIELLVVLAIIAVLSLVAIFTLNPTELLRQSRDSNRISDFGTLKTAISLYLADVTTPSLGTAKKCYGSWGPTSTTACIVPFANAGIIAHGSIYVASSTTNKAVNSTGWLPINFTSISSGAPFGTLPVDPLNTAANYYTYVATSSPGITFKLATTIESAKYKAGGPNDVVSADGGNSNLWYETGTELSL